MNRLLWILGSCAACGILLTASIPTLLSSSLGKSMLLSLVNREIDGTLSIDSLDLNWLRGQSIKGIRLTDSHQIPLVSIEEIDADTPLWRLLIGSVQLEPFHVRQLNAEIGQDANGVTNLESLFRLQKSKTNAFTSATVNLSQVNADLVVSDAGVYTLKAAGLTRQNDQKGQFNLDGSYGQEIMLKVRAQNFPLLFLDQTIAVKNPALAGLLVGAIGDSIDVTIDAQHTDTLDRFSMIAKSPYTSWNIIGKLENDQFEADGASTIQFSIPTQRIAGLVPELQFEQEKVSGSISFAQMSVPLKNLERASLDLPVIIDPLKLVYQGKERIHLDEFKAQLLSKKDSPDLKTLLTAKGKRNDQALFADIQADVAIADLQQGIDEVLEKGILTQGRVHGPVAVRWEGIVRQTDTELRMNVDAGELSLSNLKITLDRLPTKEGRPLLISFDGKGVTQKEGSIIGMFHLDSVGKPEFHLKASLEQFNPKFLQKFLPNHPIDQYVGSSVDAKIVVTRVTNGDIHSSIEVNAPKNGDGFMKSLNGKFTLEPDRDLTFDLSIQQKVGSVTLVGTLQELFDAKGNLQYEEAEATLTGHLRHFPVALATQIAVGDKALADKLEAVLGSQVDGDLEAKIHNGTGPVKVSVKGLNGNASLSGNIQKRTLTLSEPLIASLKITPQLERAVLREWLPFLGSVISSEQPIELTIAKEGFIFPLENPTTANVQVQSASVKLNKMQFSRDGHLGKVASLLGVNSQTFEVWFTPVYFSLSQGQVDVQRADFLVAGAYPLASWGAVNFNNESLRFIIAMTPAALQKAFHVKTSNSYLLQIPVKGSISRPEIDTAKVTTRISALIAQSQGGPQGLVIGTVLDAASGSFTEEKAPAPTTNPLPWTIAASSNAKDNESIPEKIVEEPVKLIEQPVKELQKGAKKLLKGLLG